MKRLLTRDEVAALLRKPKRTLDDWAYRGVGPPFMRIGRDARYDPDDLDAWLSAQPRCGTPPQNGEARPKSQEGKRRAGGP